MKRIGVLLAVCFFLNPVLADETADLGKGKILATNTRVEGGGYDRATVKGVIEAPLEKVWLVVTDYEHYGEFMPNTKENVVLTRTSQEIVYRSLLHMPFPLPNVAYETSVSIPTDHGTISFKMVPGTGKGVKDFDGGWVLSVFEGDANRTLAEYNVRMVPTVHWPKWVMRMMTKGTLTDILKAIRKRAEESKSETPPASSASQP
ncbi:MAG: SRPBCC family protein [Pseudomonadota bacterium]